MIFIIRQMQFPWCGKSDMEDVNMHWLVFDDMLTKIAQLHIQQMQCNIILTSSDECKFNNYVNRQAV